MIHHHAPLFPVLLPETVLKHISSINQFLKQQKGGKYVYATCRPFSCINRLNLEIKGGRVTRLKGGSKKGSVALLCAGFPAISVKRPQKGA
jgi:hypothetical protein